MFIVIGNPENRRVKLFLHALRRQRMPGRVLSYVDVLDHRIDWQRELSDCRVLRIDSPGESFDVDRRLLVRGARVMRERGEPCLGEDKAAGLPYDHGRIYHQRQWFCGFRSLMSSLSRRLQARWMNDPLQIVDLFDKHACRERLRRAGVPIARDIGQVTSYDELRQRMHEHSRRRVFIKPAYGSSASGVLAYIVKNDREEAFTPVELVRDNGCVKLYNSLEIRRYRDRDDIRTIVDQLAQDSLVVEEWIPKAGAQGHTFDLRLLVIGGRARHTVVRLSRSPITNLHLGNKRGNLALLAEQLGEGRLNRAKRIAELAAAAFDRCWYCGVDLAFSSGLSQCFVFECNAFGDLLPNITDAGLDTYAAEVQSFVENERVKP